jgi:kinesin family member 5
LEINLTFFLQIFEEYATQEEVFEHAFADIPIALLEGYNSTCIAYGQTGTGKTHTMMGADGGSESLLYRSFRNLSSQSGKETMTSRGISSDNDNAIDEETELDPEKEGMIPRTISALFALMKKMKPSIEFTIRVSYVEIYLEKILDLLHPHGSSGSITIEDDNEEADKAAGRKGTVRIQGASELCCFDEADVCALLARGNACRTMSSTEMNTESSRSHAIFILKLEQHDRISNKIKSSVLHMVDLAGSELASKETTKRSSMAANVSAVQTEALMINKSLSALHKMIRAQLAQQSGERDIPLEEITRQSKLSRLLRPAFGGNCLTTLILTASPSSYNTLDNDADEYTMIHCKILKSTRSIFIVSN